MKRNQKDSYRWLNHNKNMQYNKKSNNNKSINNV